MKNIIAFLILFSFYRSLAQSPDRRLPLGEVDSLYSHTLKEYRKIWIYTPHGYGMENPGRFPVVYLLDGDAHFYSVAGMIQQLSEVNGNTVCPEMVVIGILNTDRTRDLTPTNVPKSYYGSFKSSGGSENFTKFIAGELIPYINAHYPVSSYRMLIGHSFGGLFAINTLIGHPDLFNAYVAIDPSLWWDDQKILNKAKMTLHQHSFPDKSLYFAVANTMRAEMDTQRVVYDTSGTTIHIRSNLLFAKFLDSAKVGGLHYKWKYYPEDNHGSVPLIAEYDALHFLFDFYKMPYQGDPDLLSADVVSNHYREVSKRFGYAVLPPENDVNNLGYVFLGKNMFDKAYDFFMLNIKNYPARYNVYDSMGDYFVARKENGKAIEYFTKALALKDNPDTKQKLEKLKAGK
ncbi:MAG: alpha/beta hydrolase-fold protein [Bacteroidota bacterium]|nr:alpha/beta hydrolase-fold protein [Bacteroidota bacterium]